MSEALAIKVDETPPTTEVSEDEKQLLAQITQQLEAKLDASVVAQMQAITTSRMVITYDDGSENGRKMIFPSLEQIAKFQSDWEASEKRKASDRKAINEKVYGIDFTSNLVFPNQNWVNIIASGGKIISVSPSEN